MLYRIVRPLAALTLKANFRKIYCSNLDFIPDDCPVILAVNHPTAFIEPCILACFQPHPLHFLVRGDFFAKPFFRRLLERLHMIPIYRLKDGGFTNLKNNFNTFERCYEALRERKMLMILAEGTSVQEKRLRPIRKGTARIAFGAYDKYQIENLQIVPIGVNYTYPDSFRSELMIEVGEPLCLEDYLALYGKEPQVAIKQLTEDLERQMAKKIVIIDRVEDEALAEQLFPMMRHVQPVKVWPILSSERHHLQTEIKLANWINQMREAEKVSLQKEVNHYYAQLKKYGLSDFGLVQPQHYRIKNTLILLIGFFPFLLGLIGNFIPLAITNFVGDHFVKSIEFRQAVKIAGGLGFYLLYFVFLVLVCWHFSSYLYLVFVFFIPIWGYFALIYQEFLDRWKKGRLVNKAKGTVVATLRENRAGIFEKIREGISNSGQD